MGGRGIIANIGGIQVILYEAEVETTTFNDEETQYHDDYNINNQRRHVLRASSINYYIQQFNGRRSFLVGRFIFFWFLLFWRNQYGRQTERLLSTSFSRAASLVEEEAGDETLLLGVAGGERWAIPQGTG